MKNASALCSQIRPDFSKPWQGFLRKQHNNYEKWTHNIFIFPQKNEMAIWFMPLTNGHFWQYKIWKDVFYQRHWDFSYSELLATSKRQEDLQSWSLKNRPCKRMYLSWIENTGQERWTLNWIYMGWLQVQCSFLEAYD